MRRVELSLDPASSGLGATDREERNCANSVECRSVCPRRCMALGRWRSKSITSMLQTAQMLQTEVKRSGCVAQRKNRAEHSECRFSAETAKLDGQSHGVFALNYGQSVDLRRRHQ
jgi:hypothetical protein